MEDDVNKAIKQLETIAIKAMNSGYLDDAAKVMHIAEEIERVDKAGIADDIDEYQPEPVSEYIDGSQALDFEPQDFEPEDRQRVEASDVPAAASFTEGHSTGQNVVALNRFRMKRNAAVGDDSTESPLK